MRIYFPIIISIFLFWNCAFSQTTKTQKTKINHSNFKLIFKEGNAEVNHPNILNTFENTYTKDMVVDSSVKIKFNLSNKDLRRIYQKMDSIKFFEYPVTFKIISTRINKDSLLKVYRREDSIKFHQFMDTINITALKGESICTKEPSDKYYFKVQYGNKIKELYWHDWNCNKNEQADKLKQLIRLIDKIIYDNPKYKKLPRPRAIYL